MLIFNGSDTKLKRKAAKLDDKEPRKFIMAQSLPGTTFDLKLNFMERLNAVHRAGTRPDGFSADEIKIAGPDAVQKPKGGLTLPEREGYLLVPVTAAEMPNLGQRVVKFLLGQRQPKEPSAEELQSHVRIQSDLLKLGIQGMLAYAPHKGNDNFPHVAFPITEVKAALGMAQPLQAHGGISQSGDNSMQMSSFVARETARGGGQAHQGQGYVQAEQTRRNAQPYNGIS